MTRIRLVFVILLVFSLACARRGEPKNAKGYLDRGTASLDKNEYDKAIEDFNKAIELEHDAADAYFNRALAYAWKKECDKAIEDWTQALRLKPNWPDAYFNRGLAYLNKKEYDKAIEDYTHAVELDPRYVEAYANRGVAYSKKKGYDKAIEDFTKAIQLNPKDVLSYTNRGIAYRKKREYDKAIADCTKAIQMDPKNANLNNILAWIRATCPTHDLRDGKQAVELATKACELSEWKDPHCLDTLAAAKAEVGDYNEAVKWQKKAIEIGIDDKALMEELRQHLKLYEEGKPYRDAKP
jgi:tetratricopeptide (TPR) repeat protein